MSKKSNFPQTKVKNAEPSSQKLRLDYLGSVGG